MKILSFLLTVILLFTGCTTFNAATNRNEMIFVSTATEVNMGNQAHQQLIAKNKIITGTDESARLERIGQKIARISDRQDYQYRFYLVDSPEINAFTTPGGYIYFYTGLFRALKSDDEIAAVLAHEIGHCAAKHTIKKFQGALGYNVFRNVVMNVIAIKAPGIQNIAGLGADGVMTLASSAYSRQDEYEADRLGIKYLHLSGFKLDGMIGVFNVLQGSEKNSGAMPLMLRSHPYVKDRIVAVRKEIEAANLKY